MDGSYFSIIVKVLFVFLSSAAPVPFDLLEEKKSQQNKA